jgi:DNA-binding response OmpR family regulator
MAELLRQGLMEDGHAVTVTVDGREGLAIAEAGGFDLLILDVMLSGMSGLDVARQLRAQHPRVSDRKRLGRRFRDRKQHPRRVCSPASRQD